MEMRGIPKRKGSGDDRSLPCDVEDERLFERGLDAGKGRVQLRAEALHDGDDRNRDAGSNETILDSGRAGLVLHKLQEVLHLWLHRSNSGCLNEAPGAVIARLIRNRGGNLSPPPCEEVNIGSETVRFRPKIQCS